MQMERGMASSKNPQVHFQSKIQPGKLEELRMPNYATNIVGCYVFGGQGGQNKASPWEIQQQTPTTHLLEMSQ